MTTKHTPGPWGVRRYAVDHNEREVSSTARGNLRVRLRVVAGSDEEAVEMIVADMVAGGRSDAALIAAAPALLEACKCALAELEDPAGAENRHVLRGAIALAEST